MRPILLLASVVVATAVLVGCEHDAPVKPVYRTTDGLIPPMPGAAAKTIAVMSFDTSKVSDILGKTSTSIFMGVGRLTTGDYVVTNGLSMEIAAAFEMQLKRAGFNVLLTPTPKPGEPPPAADALLSGAVTDFHLSRHNRTFSFKPDDEVRGDVRFSVTLTTQDGMTVLYEGGTANARRFNKAIMLHRSTATRTADDMLGAVIDEICKAPAFQEALRKVAGG